MQIATDNKIVAWIALVIVTIGAIVTLFTLFFIDDIEAWFHVRAQMLLSFAMMVTFFGCFLAWFASKNIIGITAIVLAFVVMGIFYISSGAIAAKSKGDKEAKADHDKPKVTIKAETRPETGPVLPAVK